MGVEQDSSQMDAQLVRRDDSERRAEGLHPARLKHTFRKLPRNG